jgi:hypothetical protein
MQLREDDAMLHLLGLILQAIITIAIGIIGFTWEPKEAVETPKEKESHSGLILPVLLNVTADMTASTVLTADNCNGAKPLYQPIKPVSPRLPDVSVML